MREKSIALGVEVCGIVQGVGFRPFVYQLANRFGLKGTVGNTTAGVTIHIEGGKQDIDAFCAGLSNSPPPLALITDIVVQPKPLRRLRTFTIMPSRRQNDAATFIPPDVSVCNDCLLEMADPLNRRFRYPFINCTHCGPRYTLIEDIPYDRANTTMKHFSMCDRCRAEYEDPSNRRFHAQPNACPKCGPRITLVDKRQQRIPAADPIKTTICLLKEGHILAIKGLGGFHLAADAENDSAAATLRARKTRPDKPFALMSGSIDMINRFAHISPEEAVLLSGMAKPVVLLEKRLHHPLSPRVAPQNPYFGVMLPYTPLHYLLLEDHFTALIMTSGNRGGAPLCIDNDAAFNQLSGIADYFLVHDRPIYQRNDDTLVNMAGGKARFIRRARGAVPSPIHLPHSVQPTLACGGELKNTICLAQGESAFLSQHIGDMGNLETLDFFKDTIDHLKKITRIVPEIVAHDLHPDYLGTRYAKGLSPEQCIGVQHHHAHVVSCMAENGLDGPVIGLALDGTGFGTDGAIWGSEVLVTERAHFTRAAHFSYIPMPGGEAAIKEPWRMALSYLYHAFGKELNFPTPPFLTRIDARQYQGVIEILSKRLRSPDTSSLGRLFDGVAAMTDLCHHVTFEGQAAMAIEASAGGRLNETGDAYDWDVHPAGDRWEIGIAPLIQQIALDIAAGKDTGQISRKFHRTLICLFGDLCGSVRKETGINRVVMSGGVFQNKLLFEGLSALLRKERFEVFSHHSVPTNDGGLSLGQVVVAAARAENGCAS
ncbi:MAG: carbamoyltransferase HypF [Pseudomonadota bacterium]